MTYRILHVFGPSAAFGGKILWSLWGSLWAGALGEFWCLWTSFLGGVPNYVLNL